MEQSITLVESKGNDVLSVDVDVRATTAVIVTGYLTGPNEVPAEQLPRLIREVGGLVCELVNARVLAVHASASPVPSGEPRRKPVSTEEALQCLECQVKFRMLKRHLQTVHDLTPEDYRKKHNLEADAPMVTSGYAELRSELAKASGLGKRPSSRNSRKV